MVRLFIPILICIFGLIISSYSYITYADFNFYGAAFYPTIVGALVSFFSLMDFIMELKMRKNYVFQSFNISREIQSVGLVFCVILFYILLADVFGFITTASLILLIMTLPLIKTNRISTALLLIFFVIGIYLLFYKVLQVPLP